MDKTPFVVAASVIVTIIVVYTWSDKISLQPFTFVTSSNITYHRTLSSLIFSTNTSSLKTNQIINLDDKEKKLNKSILVFRSSYGSRKYAPSRDSIHCFAKVGGHQLLDVDLDKDQYATTTCAEFKDKNFRRHCVLLEYLKVRDDISYALALDGDVTVVNFLNKIEKFIDQNSSLIFPVRFRTMEIAACSFIVKNDPYGREFLLKWARYSRKLPAVSFTNSDNGALLALVMEELSIARPENSICIKLWQQSNGVPNYMKFMHCVSTFLGANRKRNEKIKILRRGHSWIRDFDTGAGYWCEQDFFFHNTKAESYNLNPNDQQTPYAKQINVTECKYGGGASVIMKPRNISCDELRKKFMTYVSDLPDPHLNTGTDLQCWPHCDDDK